MKFILLRFYKYIFLIIFIIFIQQNIFAHGVTGKRFFPSTIFVDDPFMAAELSFVYNNIRIPDEENGGTINFSSISSEYSQKIFDGFGLSIGENYQFIKPADGKTISGFGNLEFGLKYQFLTLPRHETVLSLGVDGEIGKTGNSKVGAEDFTVVTPSLSFGKGFGDISSADILKPFAITGIAGISLPGNSDVENTLEWGFTLQYSLQYLESYVKDIGLGIPFNRMVVVVEFPFETALNKEKSGTTTGYVCPGVMWFGKYFQLGVEAQIPANQDTGKSIGVAGIFHLFIDDIFPKSIGKALF